MPLEREHLCIHWDGGVLDKGADVNGTAGLAAGLTLYVKLVLTCGRLGTRLVFFIKRNLETVSKLRKIYISCREIP